MVIRLLPGNTQFVVVLNECLYRKDLLNNFTKNTLLFYQRK